MIDTIVLSSHCLPRLPVCSMRRICLLIMLDGKIKMRGSNEDECGVSGLSVLSINIHHFLEIYSYYEDLYII